MKSRTCPNCDYQYSVGSYFKNFATQGIGEQWKCPSCGKTLAIDMGRRFLVAVVAASPVLLGGTASAFFEQTFGLDSPWGIAVFAPIYILWGLSIFTFDGFKLAKEKS